jgi:hypothetical protein
VAPLPARKSKSTKHVSFADPLCTLRPLSCKMMITSVSMLLMLFFQ